LDYAFIYEELGKGDELPISPGSKRQQRARKSPGARKISYIVLGW